MTKNFSDKDKRDWEHFISSKEKLPNKDIDIIKKKKFSQRQIDLHGVSLDNANKIIEEFINQAYVDNINKLIIVTGKGLHSENEKNPYVSKDLSILKYSVPNFVYKNKKLMKIVNEITDAKIEDGGSGAFYIYLKKNKK